MSDFQQKIILITGASTGVGEGIARELLKRGAKVAITGRNPGLLQKAINELDPTGDSVLAIKADVRKLNDCRQMVDTVLDKFGALHGLVNNAGITGPHGVKIEDYDFEAWQDVIDTDVTGTFLGMKFGIPAIIKSGGGAVVNLSACNGITGIAGIA
ncbi:SDR family NAD(P)-dependent oxidoreductase, partial [Morganella morganii]|nr:SDR family NAD(P)-dependent oxidoreductase [Morganella morganii]